MKLMVLVLNKEELLDKVMAAYVEAGINGATILDSEGMGRFLTYEVPLFADFKAFMRGNKPYNKTIISVVRDEAAILRARELVDEIIGGFSSPGTGIMFTLPVDFAVGLIDAGNPEGDEKSTHSHASPGGEEAGRKSESEKEAPGDPDRRPDGS